MHRISTRLALAALIALAAPVGAARGQMTVGPTAHVSAGRSYAAQSEYYADADLSDPRRLAVCSMVIDPTRSRLSSALYLSKDGGRIWSVARDDTLSRYGESWDPACAFGPGGMVYFATLPGQRDPRLPAVRHVTRFHRSADGGSTWSAPIDVPFLDNEDITVDWTNGPTRGRVYMVGVTVRDSAPLARYVTLLYSDDSGRTMKGPVRHVLPEDRFQGTTGAAVITNDGRPFIPSIVDRLPPFLVRITDSLRRARGLPPDTTKRDSIPEHSVVLMPILDGGARIGDPVTVATYGSCPQSDAAPPVVAVDRSNGPFRNRMYAVFVDGAYGRCQMMLTSSDDGTKWSTPVGVDDPRVPIDSLVGPDVFFPNVVVSPQGVVGLSWYDRREDRNNRAFRQRFTVSLDGGQTFLPSVAVSRFAHTYAAIGDREKYYGLGGTSSRDRTGHTMWLTVATGQAYRTYDMVGDYGGLTVSADGVFHPVWVDNRTGVPQLYTAPVTVKGAVHRGTRLAGRDVTDSVMVFQTSSTFEPRSCTLGLTFELMNRSHAPLTLPLTVEVLRMWSQVGVPRAAKGEGDVVTGMPVWRFGERGTLAPDSVTTRAVTVPIDECTPLLGRGGRVRRTDARMTVGPQVAGAKLLKIEARVLESP